MTIQRIQSEVYSILRRLALLDKISIVSLDSDITLTAIGVSKLYLVSCPSGNVLIILPSASVVIGKPFTFKKTDSSNIVNIQPIESSTIDGNLTYQLTSQYQTVTFVSDGTNFQVTSVV